MTNGDKRTMPPIDDFLKSVERQGAFRKFERFRYTPYSDSEALEIAEAIGKSLNPKFTIDDDNRFAYQNFLRWLHCDPSFVCIDPDTNQTKRGDFNKGIYIAGNTGSGKSWCLDIMRAYCKAYGMKVQWSDSDTSNLAWATVRADAICDFWAKSGSLSDFKDKRVLGIQDFGNEPREAVYMGNKIDVLRSVLEYRGDKPDAITLLTSNLRLDGKAIAEKYGDRVASRLYAMCNYLVIRGRDRRKL